MSVLSVRMSDVEYQALEKFAKANKVSMNQAIKDAFFEKLEEEYDLEVFDKAYAEYLKDPVTRTLDEVIKDLDLKNV